jgi:hypothetical protein
MGATVALRCGGCQRYWLVMQDATEQSGCVQLLAFALVF